MTYVSVAAIVMHLILLVSDQVSGQIAPMPVDPLLKPAPKLCQGSHCNPNVCQSKGLDCCRCSQSQDAPWIEVCACCPAGYFCCNPWWFSWKYPKCCPIGTMCTKEGNCRQITPALPSNTTCKTCGPLNLAITCDDRIDELYVDGVSYMDQVKLPNTHTSVQSMEIPLDSKVIAVKCSDIGTRAGLLASTNNDYVLSNAATWKCTSAIQTTPDWREETFDDALWPQAVFGLNNGDLPYGPRPLISINADWIWTVNAGPVPKLIDKIVYCRKIIPGPGCNTIYGNCGDLCKEQDINSQCCYCNFNGFGNTKICSCCPAGYKCCTTNSLQKPVCCPIGYKCLGNMCVRPSWFDSKPTPAQFDCSADCVPSLAAALVARI